MSTSTTVPGERRQRWLARASVLLVGPRGGPAARLRPAAQPVAAPGGRAGRCRGRRVGVRLPRPPRRDPAARRRPARRRRPWCWSGSWWATASCGALLGVLLAVGLAVVVGRAALRAPGDDAAMPGYDAPPPRHPFVIMNPRSGGGKVGRFDLAARAEALGAEVFLLDEPDVDVAAVARGRRGPRRRPARGRGRRRDAGPRRRRRRRARRAVRGDQRRHPQPLRARPRARPAGPVHLPRGAHRGRGRAARRPRHASRTGRS